MSDRWKRDISEAQQRNARPILTDGDAVQKVTLPAINRSFYGFKRNILAQVMPAGIMLSMKETWNEDGTRNGPCDAFCPFFLEMLKSPSSWWNEREQDAPEEKKGGIII